MNKKTAYTDSNGIRHYKCHRCGKEVNIGRYKWAKLKPEDKRLCERCAERKHAPIERHYEPYGPYCFGFL